MTQKTKAPWQRDAARTTYDVAGHALEVVPLTGAFGHEVYEVRLDGRDMLPFTMASRREAELYAQGLQEGLRQADGLAADE